MSAIIESYLVCDFCGTTFGTDNKRFTSTQHRADARKIGWVRTGDAKDKCNRCLATLPISKHTNKKFIREYEKNSQYNSGMVVSFDKQEQLNS